MLMCLLATSVEMSLCGTPLLLEGCAITFFFTDSTSPLHICWQIKIFFPLLHILAVPEIEGD